MKLIILLMGLIFTPSVAFQAYGFQGDKKGADIPLEQVGAVEAMAIANEWKWSRKDVKSAVTAREVVFKFSDGTVTKIPLPEEKMLVAVAPYVTRTHQ